MGLLLFFFFNRFYVYGWIEFEQIKFVYSGLDLELGRGPMHRKMFTF